MDYLGHAIEESSTPTPPTPSEPDPHFKVIYRQDKVGLVRGRTDHAKVRLDSIDGTFSGSTQLQGLGAYRVTVSGSYPWSGYDDGMPFGCFQLPTINLAYGRAVGEWNGINTFIYRAEFTLNKPNAIDTLCSYYQRVEVLNSNSGFAPIYNYSSGEFVLPSGFNDILFQLEDLTLFIFPDPATAVATCNTMIIEYLAP